MSTQGEAALPPALDGQLETWLKRCRDALAADCHGPDAFETLVEELHQRVFALEGAAQRTPPWLDALRTALHSESAQFEAVQLERQAHLHALVQSQQVPALAVSEHGAVLVAGHEATRVWGIAAGDGLEQLGLSRSQWLAFRQRCLSGGEAVSLLMAQRDGEPLLFAGSSMPGLSAWLLVAVRWSMPRGLSESLCAVFGLSARECEVLGALCQGMSVQGIADTHERSVGTVRQQVKAVLQKLGVGSQAQAIALVAAASASYHELQGISSALAADPHVRCFNLRTPAGRTLGWREYGDPAGQPVLFLHGALYGVGALAAERAAACELGLRVLAPERPGYGATPGVPFELLMRVSVDDILALLDAQDIPSVVVMAHDVGTALAFHLAAWAPQRVRAIAAAPATPPMRSWGQTAVMPPAHRIHAWTAQHAPWLMDTLVSIGLAQVRRQGHAAMPDLIFGGCAFDRDAWLQQTCLPAAAAAFSLISAQQAQGFKQDMRLTNVDWSALAAGVDVPVWLCHGDESRTVNEDGLRAFVASLPQGRLEAVSGAGHTLPLTHPGLLPGLAAQLGA